ncbi:MAG: bifunctional oligoribonuclease/PAP phosphatase NrnA [Eubacterium sp.]|nr:bifunctional oligoribonuclease/PAP phosphatase NrnA [Eubacterium sp.]
MKTINVSTIASFLDGVRSIAIAGHVNPDGDCVGSCMAMYLYLTENYPQIHTDVYMQKPKDSLCCLKGMDQIRTECGADASYDLLILLDISSTDRIGVAGSLLEKTERVLCLDHHKTNEGSYTWFYNDPDASSACEVIWRFLEEDRVSLACAEALYLGIAHDTGVFQYQSTSPETMRIAAKLMEKGVRFTEILDKTYYQKTYAENQILARALMESFTLYNGQVIVTAIKSKTMKFYGLHPKDMDGIVNQLRNTEGVEVAIFMYETAWLTYKVSLRSRTWLDVSKVAAAFGGGGHKHAAGCTMEGMHRDVINNLSDELFKQFEAHSAAAAEAAAE